MNIEDQILEPTLDVELSPMMELAPALVRTAPASATPPGRYWRAQGLADTLRCEFDEASKTGNLTFMREQFYLLANYYHRTSAILRYALSERREELAQAALHNLIALHAALRYMHRAAPSTVPSTLALNRELRYRLFEDLIVRVVEEATRPLDVATITSRVNDLDLLAQASERVTRRHLGNLAATGHLEPIGETYIRTTRAYSPSNPGRANLQTLLDPAIFQHLDAAGLHTLADILAHKQEFRSLFGRLTGFSDSTGALALAAIEVLTGPPAETSHLSPWQHADLIGSSHLRPYQHEAYAVFRAYDYRGQVIEAPTGSGKTMIGMMCIQDWLRSLSQGQSILVLVPTVNYQQQWVGELCYNPLGLRLSPHQVFTGTPAALEVLRSRAGISPCVIVMTYTALAQTGSGSGKGGFDQDSVEIFLQGSNIQYVILDEVHKVVEDPRSVSADVTRLLTDWLHDGSLGGVIGFSGTAAAYRQRYASLGLQLAYILPAADLIAYGFVAPFAEFGVPFAYSDREQRIRSLLDAYKARMREFIALVGSANWRRWFAAIPMEERIAAARTLWRSSGGVKDRDEVLAKRLEKWEQGGELSLVELPLVTLVQLANGWSDEDALRAACQEDTDGRGAIYHAQDARLPRFQEILRELETLRSELKSLIYLADTVRRLSMEGFGKTLDTATALHLSTEKISSAVRRERAKDALATTIVGLYDSLSDWYLRVGEGRVDSIKAIIDAERASRIVHGVIIFDAGTRIRWRSGVAAPGYGGVAGVFSQMLDDRRFTPLAVLSSEMYLAYDEADPLPTRIAAFIQREIMCGELGDALFGLTTQGLGLREDQLAGLRTSFDAILERYVSTLAGVGAARTGEFARQVLTPFRKAVRQAKLRDLRDKLLARLSLKHYHVRNSVNTFFDYAMIVEAFLHPHVAELVQVSGAHQQFFVVKMAQGERKQLMYDLTSRIVDAEDIPINMVIVSPWARTGWNVLKPNVLIDATATRDVTAWQQLRGRAMRARRTWTNECYRLVLLLLGSRPLSQGEVTSMIGELAPGVALPETDHLVELLDERARALLREAHQAVGARFIAPSSQNAVGAQFAPAPQHSMGEADPLSAKIERGIMAELTTQERVQLVSELMLARNKVTHIYELVKAYGGAPQIHYDRPTNHWERTESISAKHEREYAVSPLSGQFSSGAEHAPLIYAGDPRKDMPSELEAYLVSLLKEADPRITQGWLRVIADDKSDEMAL